MVVLTAVAGRASDGQLPTGTAVIVAIVLSIVGGLTLVVCLYFSARKLYDFVFNDEDDGGDARKPKAKAKDIQFVDVTSATAEAPK